MLSGHYPNIISSKMRTLLKPSYRRCIAINETKLKEVKKTIVVYVWSAVDIDSKELLALERLWTKL
ncbi:MAG: hypothetical protein QXP91_11935 [Candidatus Methanomethylicia archaeon]